MCIYNEPKDLLVGIETVTKRVKKGDTCLKKIMRVKNGFIENKKEAQELLLARGEKRKIVKNDYLYQYADIKLNIMMSHEAKSMIVECQFLLRFVCFCSFFLCKDIETTFWVFGGCCCRFVCC